MTIKNFTFRPQATFFNVANSNVILGYQRNFGAAQLSGSMRQILSPRVGAGGLPPRLLSVKLD